MAKPDSTDPTPSLTKALGRRAQVNQHLQGISRTLGVTGRAPSASAVLATNRRLGRDAARIAERAANTVDLCPKPFGHIKTPTYEVRAEIERLKELEDSAAGLDAAAQQVRDEMNGIRVRFDDFVGEVYTATQGTLQNAFWAEDEQEGLRQAAQPFLVAIEERAGTIRTAMSDTRTRNTETATKIAETEAKATRLEVENRFLAGEDLRPSDLTAGAAPSAARTARRPARTRRAPRR
jgi:hypothetical protein